MPLALLSRAAKRSFTSTSEMKEAIHADLLLHQSQPRFLTVQLGLRSRCEATPTLASRSRKWRLASCRDASTRGPLVLSNPHLDCFDLLLQLWDELRNSLQLIQSLHGRGDILILTRRMPPRHWSRLLLLSHPDFSLRNPDHKGSTRADTAAEAADIRARFNKPGPLVMLNPLRLLLCQILKEILPQAAPAVQTESKPCGIRFGSYDSRRNPAPQPLGARIQAEAQCGVL